jgi:hypothetical protein
VIPTYCSGDKAEFKFVVNGDWRGDASGNNFAATDDVVIVQGCDLTQRSRSAPVAAATTETPAAAQPAQPAASEQPPPSAPMGESEPASAPAVCQEPIYTSVWIFWTQLGSILRSFCPVLSVLKKSHKIFLLEAG